MSLYHPKRRELKEQLNMFRQHAYLIADMEKRGCTITIDIVALAQMIEKTEKELEKYPIGNSPSMNEIDYLMYPEVQIKT